MLNRLLCIFVLIHAASAACAADPSGTYPAKPVRIIDGFPPGGGTDFTARLIGSKLAERFGQPVINDNRPGASSNIGAELAAHAEPDGYTYFIAASTTLATSRSFFPRLGYDLFNDFAYVSRIAIGPYVLVTHPSLPVKSLAELVTMARARPDTIRYGSGGVGNSNHLIMELLEMRAGMRLVHVPYKGGPPFVVAMTSGEVQVGFPSVAAALAMVKAKRLNALAVGSAKRLAILPDVPTVAESGYPAFDASSAYGLLAPRATPVAIVRKMNAAIASIVQMPDVKAKFADQGMEAAASTPEEWRAAMQTEAAQWARVIRDAHITAN